MFWLFDREACGVLSPHPGVETACPGLEGEVLTTGSPGKSQAPLFLILLLAP